MATRRHGCVSQRAARALARIRRHIYPVASPACQSCEGSDGPASDITALLDAWSRGTHGALDQLLPLVYDELRRIAHRQLRRERAGHTLQPTALVHEVFSPDGSRIA